MILKTNLLKPSPKRLVIIDMSDKQNQKETDFGFQRVAEDDKARQVREVFDSVAPKYDLMNDVLSFGMHRLWKCYAIHKADIDRGMKVLDLASGTADLSLKFAKLVGKDGEVWPTDINRSMLSLGAQRLRQAGFDMPVVQCDCEELPFPDNTFDVVIVSFGLRNMTHKDRALAEMQRVCKPGGKVMVLEFSKVYRFFAPFYDFYSFHLMPWLGGKISGDSESYRYLPESIRMHPSQPVLAGMMREAGLESVDWHNLTFGVCALHIGRKPLV